MSDGLTRRGFLGGLAASGLLGGAAPAAAAAGSEPVVFSRWVGAVPGRSGPLAAPRRFALAGVQWRGPRRARIELRARARGGPWSRWGVASTLGHGPDGGARGPAPDGPIGEPVYTGPADFVELRSTEPLTGVLLHFVATAAPTSLAATEASAPLAQPVLHAGPGQPPILARSAWAGTRAPPAVVPGYGVVKMAFVHHTVSVNGYGRGEVPSIIRGIYDYHRFVRGWNDIGYNFLVDLYGRVWEGRLGGIDQAVVGAQAGGYNLESTGTAVIGTFSSVVPSAAALSALERVLAWKLSLHGVPTHGRVTVVVDPADAFYTPFRPGQHVSLPRVAGHRDGDSTDCPGDALYARLPRLRTRIRRLAGQPARIVLDPLAQPGNAAAPFPVTGLLTDLNGVPLAGAPVEVQTFTSDRRTTVETTIATATTNPDGSFSAPVPLTRLTLVRALHRDPPAAVSTLVAIEVSPAITVAAPATTPFTVTGTVNPPTKTATVQLFAVQPSGPWTLAASLRVGVAGGRYAATFPTPAPGPYEVLVRTPADAVSAAGVSTPLAVTVPPASPVPYGPAGEKP